MAVAELRAPLSRFLEGTLYTYPEREKKTERERERERKKEKERQWTRGNVRGCKSSHKGNETTKHKE